MSEQLSWSTQLQPLPFELDQVSKSGLLANTERKVIPIMDTEPATTYSTTAKPATDDGLSDLTQELERLRNAEKVIQRLLADSELKSVLAGWAEKTKALEDARKKAKKAAEAVATLQEELSGMRLTRDRWIREAALAAVPTDTLAKIFKLSGTAVRKIAKDT